VAAAAVLLISTIGSDPVLSFAPRDWILVTDVDNQTGERVLDTALGTAFVVSLEQSTYANVFPRSRIAAALKRMGKADAPPITEAVGREICVREKVRGLISPAISKVGQSYSLTARIIDPTTGDTVRSYIQDAPNQDRILPALGALAANIRRDLGESLAAIDQSNKALPQVTTSSLEALSMYANGAGLWSKAKYDQAVQLYLSALKLDPDFAMAHAAVGVAYHSFLYNRPAEAKVHLERAMQLSARTTRREAQIIEIEYEGALGHFDKVRGLYETFLKTYPDDFRMRYNFGNELRDHGNYGEAIDQYLEVLRISPNDANAYINLATCYSSLERTSDALKAYAHAFELEPGWMTSGNLNHEYGFVWVRAGDLTKAEEVFKKGLAAGNTPLSTRSLALLHMYRGQYRKAIERLREAVLLNQSAKVPLSESRNQLFLATALEARGDRKGSAAAVERAAACLRAEVGQIWLASRIGTAFARQGAVERARAVLRKCEAEAQAGNTQQSSDLNRLRGETAWASGEREQAREFLRVADAENHTPLSQESLARAARLGGQTEDAIAAYEALLAMHDLSLGWEPQQLWIEGHYWLAELYRRRGDTTKAQALLDSFLLRWKDADPDVPMLKNASDLRAQVTASARPTPSTSSRLPVATGR
jgi:tetratricopeptide (TPR) repeat protein